MMPNMRVYRISAITLKVDEMGKSCQFYSRIPGFRIVYGGTPEDTFSTFEISEGAKKAYLNLELIKTSKEISQVRTEQGEEPYGSRKDFGRIIFYTENVDGIYSYMKRDEFLSKHAVFETEPADAPWGRERYFHIRELNGYQLSFAQPLPEH